MPFHTLESPAKWQRTQLYRCLLLLLRLRVQSVLQSCLLPRVQWQLARMSALPPQFASRLGRWRKYKRLQQQQRHSPLSSKARCLLLSKLDASATSTPSTTSLMSASLMSTSLLSELDALLVKLKDYPGLHVEEFKDQDRGEGWIVVSR